MANTSRCSINNPEKWRLKMFTEDLELHAEDTLGGRISFARATSGLSVEEAAERLGVLPESWKAWEFDRDVPRANRLTMMAGILGASPSWFLTGQGYGPLAAPETERQVLRDALRQVTADAEALNRRLRSIASRIEAS
jgi:transcriptional regulator with XRE-family HTH domain